MRDIDRALARGYAAPTRPEGAVPPAPHFSMDSGPRPGAPEAPGLAWPETVRSLERLHGDRFARLADAVIAARESRGWKALLVTSAHRAEGRTTLVLTLARALARRPGRVVLVDGDLGGPMLARQLGLRPRLGLDDVIGREMAEADALVVAPDDHLAVLPLRAPVDRPREFLASDGWPRLMSRLRREFDSVLIDGGPLFTGPSAAALPRSVDAAILVHRLARADAAASRRAREALASAGVPLLGVAETFC